MDGNIRLCFGTYMNVLEYYLPSSTTKSFFRRSLFGFVDNNYVDNCSDTDLAKMATGVNNVSPQLVTSLLKINDGELITGISNGILRLLSVNHKAAVVIALKELLRRDNSISEDAEITVISKLTKYDLINTDEVVYDEFIASIFRYTCLQVPNISTQDEIKKLDSDFYQSVTTLESVSNVLFVEKYTLEKNRELFDECDSLSPLLVRLILVGGWKEKNKAEKSLVAGFCETDWKNVSHTIKDLLVKGYNIFQIDGDNCQCNNHISLLKRIAPFVFEDDIREFFGFLEIVFFERANSVSDILKINIAETMAALGANAFDFVNCKEGLILKSIYTFEKRLFESMNDATEWENISAIVGMLAEAYPEAFFDLLFPNQKQLRESLCNYLNSRNESLRFRSRGSDIAWTLRRLAVLEDYYSRSIQFMFLASKENDVFQSMLEDILWPMYSQTHSSLELRKGVLKSLFTIDEERAFELVLKEMPNQKTSTTGEVMPLYRRCNPISHELDSMYFYEIISFYVELLCNYSKNDLHRIKGLVTLVRGFRGDTQSLVVATIVDAYEQFSEDEKKQLWYRITDYYGFYHGKIGNPKVYSESDIQMLNACFERILEDSEIYEDRRIFNRNATIVFSLEEEEEISKARQAVIKNILKSRGLNGLTEFSNTIEDTYGFGRLVFEVLNKTQRAKFVKTSFSGCTLEMQAGYIEGCKREVSDILPVLSKVSQVRLLARCGLYSEFLDNRVSYSRTEIESFYRQVETAYIPDLDDEVVKALVKGMSKVNRFDEIVKLVHRWMYISQDKGDYDYLADFFVEHADELCSGVKNYAKEDIIIKLLNSEIENDKKESLAWKYCTEFYDSESIICHCLWEKLANEPAYFCKLVHMIHTKDLKNEQYSKCYRILSKWNVVPGTFNGREELFDSKKFKDWMDYVNAEEMTSEERLSAQHYIGGALVFAPKDKTFIMNPEVSLYLENNPDAQIGYRVGSFNNKNQFYADDASEFISREEACVKNARDAGALGYIGLEVMFRDMAKEYHDFAEMNKKSRRTRLE